MKLSFLLNIAIAHCVPFLFSFQQLFQYNDIIVNVSNTLPYLENKLGSHINKVNFTNKNSK